MKFLIVFDTSRPGAWSVLPDSVGLINDRPLFVPDFAGGASGFAAIAVKITRLGKCIEARFAYRYRTQVAPALIVMPSSAADMLAQGLIPPVTSLCFDSAIVTGRWTDYADENFTVPDYQFTHYDTPISISVADIDSAIERLSELNTLKTGDIILFPADRSFTLIENDIIKAGVRDNDSEYLLRTKIK